MLGLGFIGVSGVIGSLSDTHFDGVLDLHTGFVAPWWIFLAEGVIDWLALALVLWLAALMLAPRPFRAIDLFGTQALARWPMLFAAIAFLLPGIDRCNSALMKWAQNPTQLPSIPVPDVIAYTVAILIALLSLVWFVALAWKSFRISCDFSGGKAIATFVVGLMIAEVLSKIAIWFLFKLI